MLSAKRLYGAVLARDPRYDGRFFTGVTTTGIFCRPVCPARTPKPEHCTFFTTVESALAAGFRPCRRCRPASVPGSPAWLGTKSTVARAMRLIASGALDREPLPALCDRLGVGERHLRRLFTAHLGTTPHALALARRVLLAKRSIEETSQPFAEVAFASGFRSLRTFNTALAKVCGKSPRELRRAHGARLPDSTELTVMRAWLAA
jgi:AraC family transcriptional regulator of adaptative response / DNA-3-methyladenine glycosylase II